MADKSRVDRLLEVLDIGLQEPRATYNTGNVEDCWLCNGLRATTDIGLCDRCYGWCTFQHDEEPRHVERYLKNHVPMADVDGFGSTEVPPWSGRLDDEDDVYMIPFA